LAENPYFTLFNWPILQRFSRIFTCAACRGPAEPQQSDFQKPTKENPNVFNVSLSLFWAFIDFLSSDKIILYLGFLLSETFGQLLTIEPYTLRSLQHDLRDIWAQSNTLPLSSHGHFIRISSLGGVDFLAISGPRGDEIRQIAPLH